MLKKHSYTKYQPEPLLVSIMSIRFFWHCKNCKRGPRPKGWCLVLRISLHGRAMALAFEVLADKALWLCFQLDFQNNVCFLHGTATYIIRTCACSACCAIFTRSCMLVLSAFYCLITLSRRKLRKRKLQRREEWLTIGQVNVIDWVDRRAKLQQMSWLRRGQSAKIPRQTSRSKGAMRDSLNRDRSTDYISSLYKLWTSGCGKYQAWAMREDDTRRGSL